MSPQHQENFKLAQLLLAKANHVYNLCQAGTSRKANVSSISHLRGGGGGGGGTSSAKGIDTVKVKGWKECPNVPATEANAKHY